VPGLRRRRDDLGVVTVGEHGASAARPRPVLADRGIEVLGRRDLKALHPRREGTLAVGLHEQMQMRSLNAEVHDPKVLAPRGGQRGLADRLVRRPAAQVADLANDAQYDVHWMPRL
jgi:hypothetical protein